MLTLVLLTVPRPAPSPSAPRPAGRPVPPPSAPAGIGHRPLPGRVGAPAAAGMPQWLRTVLLAGGLLTAAACLGGLVLLARGGQQAAGRAARPGAGKASIVVAGHDRLVVICSRPGDTVYVLRPPGADPREILRVARLVLPEDLYRELAEQLGMPASWPIILADHDRVVVAYSTSDGTVYVLRPPGADPRAVLRAARLVLPEDPYGELADQLGVPASWPREVPAKAGGGRTSRPGPGLSG